MLQVLRVNFISCKFAFCNATPYGRVSLENSSLGNTTRVIESPRHSVAHAQAAVGPVPENQEYIRKLYFMKRMIRSLVIVSHLFCSKTVFLTHPHFSDSPDLKLLAYFIN